jgi:hypothetical protein
MEDVGEKVGRMLNDEASRSMTVEGRESDLQNVLIRHN